MITLLVNLQSISLSVKLGFGIAVSLPDSEYLQMFQWLTEMVVICVIYQGVLMISYLMVDPWGHDVLDSPLEAYTNSVKQTIDAIYI